MKPHQVFVVGPDARGLDSLRRHAPDCEFHELLPFSRVKGAASFRFDALVAEAEAKLDAAGIKPDAVIGTWDFPTSCLVPMLCDRLGLPSATLPGAVACEHKYWSRLAQRRAGCDTPRFAWIDPYQEAPLSGVDIDYPLWIKPIKSYGSHLAFLLRGPRDASAALAAIRARGGWLAEPFADALAHVALPDDVREVGAHACLVEEHIEGRLCTLEGYVVGGQVVTYAIVDSFKDDRGLSFGRYQVPSALPASVQRRMHEAATAIMHEIAYGDAPFNIEFFYDDERDRLAVLEINPRLSRSHAEIIEMVDGAPHLRVLTDLALGREPRHPHREGPHSCAAHFFLRAYADGIVASVPHPAKLRALERLEPSLRFQIRLEPGQQLSELAHPTYSYELGTIDVGGRDEADILARFRAVRDALRIHIAPLPSGSEDARAP